MEAILKQELNTATLKKFGSGGGGCINTGLGYLTDQGKVFVKMNSKSQARRMFDGEAASLEAILATGTMKVPKPMKVVDNPNGGAVLVMEYMEMKSLSRHSALLGEQLARMHLYNEEVAKKADKQSGSVHRDKSGPQYVDKFGFHITTCCGYIPQDNTWEDDWVTFYIRHKLQQQMDLIEKEYHDSEARTLWGRVIDKIPPLFKDIEVRPALLHGDMWGGNVAEDADGPVLFDPATFYGHHEYELGIASMFGGFDRQFYSAYHKVIPKAPGFENRNSLYQLFHYLNHW